jgi:hypothetical protein
VIWTFSLLFPIHPKKEKYRPNFKFKQYESERKRETFLT